MSITGSVPLTSKNRFYVWMLAVQRHHDTSFILISSDTPMTYWLHLHLNAPSGLMKTLKWIRSRRPEEKSWRQLSQSETEIVCTRIMLHLCLMGKYVFKKCSSPQLWNDEFKPSDKCRDRYGSFPYDINAALLQTLRHSSSILCLHSFHTGPH